VLFRLNRSDVAKTKLLAHAVTGWPLTIWKSFLNSGHEMGWREVTFSLEAPSFCRPSATIWARGWLSGERTWFKARIVKLRRRVPTIHVVYVEDAQGNANPLALPNLKEANVNASDLAPLT